MSSIEGLRPAFQKAYELLVGAEVSRALQRLLPFLSGVGVQIIHNQVNEPVVIIFNNFGD